MRHPPLMPSWGAPPQPTRGGVRIPRPVVILLGLLTVGLLAGLTRSPRGLLVIAAACLLVATWDASRRGGGILRVVALLALLMLAAPAPISEQPSHRKAPMTVEATQADQLAEARCSVVSLYASLAQGFPALPDATPCPPSRKRGR